MKTGRNNSTERNSTNNDYLELGDVNDHKRPGDGHGGYLELGNVNSKRIGNCAQYNRTDYDVLRRDDPRQDQHIYRGLQFDTQDGTRKNTTRQHHSDLKAEIPVTAEHKKSGHRVFILIIVLLVVLLVAMAATFGVLYTGGFFDKDGSSDSQVGGGTGKTSLSTTTAVTTTPATLTTTTTEPLSIEERCQSYDGMIPHPSECQVYYNCSDTSMVNTTFVSYYWGPYLNECPYPQLFNTETMACENFETVDCGDREEAKDKCDYRLYLNQCTPGRFCIPCPVKYPGCKGYEDGFNIYYGRNWSPHYILCHKERFITELRCPTDPVSSLIQLFSPEFRACVPLDRIPSQHGGYKPNCTGKADGRYPNNYGRCNYYIICSLGQYARFESCEDGTRFDETTKICTATANTCECENKCESTWGSG